ncbi:MAG: bifunctional 2-polyprenyl-6-hydroxyphenol methylase/3-demethylubiquinol 3-O-methyltransferase UbiG [Goleter apudmare HA4340-LM2]|jgi:2-polyprenyl-6-hydroxyphenyl methylase/3-demethylubiquinone-9 3-methyltransferase|nr:bifunctional 2-polyprenyl-6-hydroxyphenol methylase/3-demethylubiquinol 3-O-methyltransferase UbiG [Goleter apudmare HA4340-LM2]
MKKNDLEYYDLNADKWWQKGEALNLSNYLNQARFDFFANYVPNWRGVQVLDIGCGGGLACEFLAKQDASVTGIDLSLKSIQVAQEHAQRNQLKIDYYWGIAEELPFDNNKFDVVLCFDVLEHVGDWKKVIFESFRVLKPEGLFLFDTINKTFKSRLVMIWLLEYVLKQIPLGLHDWHKFIKSNELFDMLRDNGFRDIIFKGFDLTGGTNLKNLSNIVFKRFKNDSKTLFEIAINEDTSVWYIGKAVKPK